MSNKVYFMNNGYFDVRQMLTFGLSVKSGDNPIGFFGTGFKYAIAIILRLGGTIKVTSGDEITVFECKKETIKGKEFGMVYYNDKPAGFTTHLGANWAAWQAFRELYCNTKDEGGTISRQLQPFETVIEVNCKEIFKALEDKNDYFLEGEPDFTLRGIAEIYNTSKPYIYYRGIAVKEIKENKLSYNILSSISLTEDRTCRFQYEIEYKIQQVLQALDNKEILKNILKAGDHYEAGVQFDMDYTTSKEFIDATLELIERDGIAAREAMDLVRKLTKHKVEFKEFYMSEVQHKMFKKACLFLEFIDVYAEKYPIKFVEFLGEGVMGCAADGNIYIAKLAFEMGTKQLASTLLEEWVHTKTGCADFDRRMQNWLFDKILTVAESAKGEPL